MAYLISGIVQLFAGMVALAGTVLGLMLSGIGTLLGLGFAAAVIILVVLAVLLSPWFVLALAAWILWRALGPRRPRRSGWQVVR